jgi:hypothetical protein
LPAFYTYTLLSALASGLQSRFHPEVLGLSLSKALVVVIIEFCGIKLGCYLLDVRKRDWRPDARAESKV